MNREAFLAALRRHVIATHVWARTDETPERLDRFMNLTRETMSTTASLVAIDGEAFRAAWKEIGGKGKLTYKALRELPAE